jgi:hypothetical protein
MPEFREDLVQLLLEHRSAPASALFQTFNFLGDLEGYVLVVSFIYLPIRSAQLVTGPDTPVS